MGADWMWSGVTPSQDVSPAFNPPPRPMKCRTMGILKDSFADTTLSSVSEAMPNIACTAFSWANRTMSCSVWQPSGEKFGPSGSVRFKGEMSSSTARNRMLMGLSKTGFLSFSREAQMLGISPS
jgi:hypothetical protein